VVRRLTGSDAACLALETETGYMHVGGLVLVDPTDAPGFGIDSLAELIAARIHGTPKFTWRVREVPLGIDRPVWVDAPDFEVRDHLHHIAVPAPGTLRELAPIVGDIMSHRLDRRRPLWEMWLIEGLESGQIALFSKYHHALADGASGQGLAEQLLDLEPHPVDDGGGEGAADPSTVAEPSTASLVGRGLVNSLGAGVRIGRYLGQSVRRGVTMLGYQRNEDSPAPGVMDAPPVPWFGELSKQRAVSYASVPLEGVKQIRRECDVKVNDVILAVVAGALREYLIAHEALPDKPLISSVPISTRTEDSEVMSNEVANMFVYLATDFEDADERLAAIHRSTQGAKEMTDAIRAHEIRSIGETAPPLLINLASRMILTADLMSHFPTANVVVSNVPGPAFPLYMCGAKLTAIYPSGPLMAGMGLNVTVMSYLDSLDFGFQVDPNLIPDPWEMAAAIPRAYEELEAAVGLSRSR